MRVRPPNAGKGRPKGSRNKTTALLKDAILKAAENAGGEDGIVGYLTEQATANPQNFIPLLAKVLPLQITGDAERRVAMTKEQRDAVVAAARKRIRAV